MNYIILVALLLPSLAFGRVGEIGKIKGSGALERGSESIVADDGVGVQTMDTAVTAKGRMRIDFMDDTRVDITEHSRLLIDEFVYDPNQNIGKLSIKATLGTVRYASGQIAKRYQQNVKIKTPSATIGVRGTDFIMVVDELGGSMITLLPSCDADLNCYVGEIEVETDAGIVIMNQAFQATLTTTHMQPPSPPLILPLDENQIGSLLILRKKNPYEEEEEAEAQRRKLSDFLGIDYLAFDALDYDALEESIKDIWVTELDQHDYMLQEVLHDILDQLNRALAVLFQDEILRQNKTFFRDDAIRFGFDPATGITLLKEGDKYIWERRDPITNAYTRLKLSRQGDYTINIKQGEFEIYDYQIGVDRRNSIDITQN